jgi:predicted nucleotidyltransferase
MPNARAGDSTRRRRRSDPGALRGHSGAPRLCDTCCRNWRHGAHQDPTAQCPGAGIAARVGVLRKWEVCLRPEASDSAIMRATTEPPWLVTPEKVHAVVGRLIEMAHPKQIILFGSYARGKISEDSDLDVLIVAGDEVENTRRESVRLRGALKEIEMPIDIVVVRESTFQKLSDTPGLIYEEARRTGLLVYECES